MRTGRQGLVSLHGHYGPPTDIKEKVKTMATPEIEDVLVAFKFVEFAVKAIEDEASVRIQKNPEDFTRFEWRSGYPRRVLAEGAGLPEVAGALVDLGVTPDEILSCLRSDALALSKTSKLEKLIYAKLNTDPDAKKTHKDADAAMMEALGELVAMKTPDPKLFAVKPKKEEPKKVEGKEVQS